MNGNPDLVLRDIHAAPPPDFWPPAPGWWVVALLALLALALLGRWLYRRYVIWRRRRFVLVALKEVRKTFDQDGNAAQFAAGLSMLLRRVALARFPRATVAGLSGARWLCFLDETGGGGRFANGPGSVLLSAPYAPHTALDGKALYTLVKDWIKRNA